MLKKQVLRPAIATGLLLMIPLVMTVLEHAKPAGYGWHWSPADFIVMGALVFCAGLIYEFLAVRMHGNAYRVALAAAIAVVVLAIWVELAVDGVSQLVGLLTG